MSIRVVHRPEDKGPFSMDYRNGITCTVRVSRTVYPAHGNSKEVARGKKTDKRVIARERSGHNSNSKRVVRNPKETNVGMKGNSPKQGLTRADDITIELSEGRESACYRLH